jgi:type II restriction enzyme
MATVDAAKKILKALGLPPAQQTDVAAYTLLALANLGTKSRWLDAERRFIRIHAVLEFTSDVFRKRYAENTRETVRRQVIHQFEQARVVDRNPDEPGLATNSPLTHYAISEAALLVIRGYGTKTFKKEAQAFIDTHGSLLAIYSAAKDMRMVPLILSDGTAVALSPGKHNELQVAIIKEFAERFAPGSALLYLGDTAKKSLVVAEDMLAKLGFPMTEHVKLPDVVLYLEERNWLFLIEAVTSHGPVSPKRHFELEKDLVGCSAARIYVSAFPNFKEFKRHIDNIAWETEVWIAENPDHMIHFNGEKFLGPVAH